MATEKGESELDLIRKILRKIYNRLGWIMFWIIVMGWFIAGNISSLS